MHFGITRHAHHLNDPHVGSIHKLGSVGYTLLKEKQPLFETEPNDASTYIPQLLPLQKLILMKLSAQLQAQHHRKVLHDVSPINAYLRVNG